MSNIVIADNHALMRFSIKRLLEQSGHTVVAEAESGNETLEVVNLHEPHILILELDLPELHGLEVIALLSARKCVSKILALTAYDAENYLLRSVLAGASGFLSKTCAVTEIQRAVKTLLRGKKYFPSITPRMVPVLKRIHSAQTPNAIRLTKREDEILQLLSKGYNNQEIAKLLFISHKTVSAYKMRLLQKFNTSHLLSMIEAACRGGHV